LSDFKIKCRQEILHHLEKLLRSVLENVLVVWRKSPKSCISDHKDVKNVLKNEIP
jgi:hypothetical protein